MQILDFPFPDHHAPPLTFLFTIVNAVDSWIEASPENVAIVHCKGGKGRTGVVIVCWLMYSALFPDIGAAAKHFAAKRSATAKGVTQPSQVRYLTYFSNTLLMGRRPPCQRYRLVSVFFGPVPKAYAGSFSVQVLAYHGDTSDELFCADSTRAEVVGVSASGENYYQVLVGVSVVDDVLIRFHEAHKKTGAPKKLFHIVFHTGFLNTADHDICFKYRDLDNPSKKVPRTFTFSCQMERRADTLGDPGAGPDPFIQKMCQTFQKRIRKKCGAPLGSHRGGLEIVTPERDADLAAPAAGTPSGTPSPSAGGVTSIQGSAAPGHWAARGDGLGRGESPGNDTSTMLSRILGDDIGDEAPSSSSSSSVSITSNNGPSPLDAVSMSTDEFSPPTTPRLPLSTSLPAPAAHFAPLPLASVTPSPPPVSQQPQQAQQQPRQWQQAPTFQRANHRITFSPPLQRNTTIGHIRAGNTLCLQAQPCVRIGERAAAGRGTAAVPVAAVAQPSPTLPHSVPLQLPPELLQRTLSTPTPQGQTTGTGFPPQQPGQVLLFPAPS